MSVQNLDDFFESIYGFKPAKRGAGYELLVGAVLKILNKDSSVTNNVFIKSNYSDDKYQADNLIKNEQEKVFVEVKDYAEKVGRPDVSKLSGAILQLPVDKGIVATAQGYTKPAKQYTEDCLKNPNAKPIDLYIVRPFMAKDAEGRLLEIRVQLFIQSNDYSKAEFNTQLADGASGILKEMGYEGNKASFIIDGFYRADGTVIETLWNLTSKLNTIVDGVYVGKWEFLEQAYIYCKDKLIPIKCVEYKIPIKHITHEFLIKSGKPLVYVCSNDGTIDKVITEEELKSINFQQVQEAV